MEIVKAELQDLPSILSLQKLAYQSEAEIVKDYTIPPLHQTIGGITDEFYNGIILKAIDSGEIVGSVRVYFSEGTLYIGKLIVDPLRQNQGAGTALLLAAEKLEPGVRYELFTSSKSEKNLYLYNKLGYREFKQEPLNENAKMIFLEKERAIRVYLDVCCYSRPFDPPASPTIIFESSAKMLVQTLIVNGEIDLVNSFVVYEELSAIAGEEKRDLMFAFLTNAKIYVAKDKINEVLQLAKDIMKTGIKYMDASHVACAIAAGSDFLLTTDKRLLKYNSGKINIVNPIDFIRIWEEKYDA
jgi:predicted nucleic acid-binding protein/GNAT superfamily N-acetyltransferase